MIFDVFMSKSTALLFSFYLFHLFFFLFLLFSPAFEMSVSNDPVVSPSLAYYLCFFLIVGYEHFF